MDYSTIKAMHDAGIQFLGAVEDPFGQLSMVLDPHEVADFVRDPVDYAARKNGARRADWEECLKFAGEPRCAAMTRKGRLCLNATGGASGFREWLDRHRNAYCGIHGGVGKNASWG